MQDRVQPKISIVTVVYNDKVGLERTIKSVVSQSYEDIEYIIIDGGSTDGTVEVIEKYREHIAYWVSEADNGIFDGMNKGVSVANGDYLQFLNAGDELEDSQVIEKMVKHFDKESIYFGKAKNILDNKVVSYRPEKEIQADTWIKSDLPNHLSMFFPKHVYQELQYDTRLKTIADTKYKLEAFQKSDAVFVDMLIVKFYLGGVSSKCYNFGEMKAKLAELFMCHLDTKRYDFLIRDSMKTIIKYLICKGKK